jgi:enoyl-CoA hydratase/carnithine racemase
MVDELRLFFAQLAADVRLASASARMNAAFIRIGLSACDIGVSYFLPRLIGSSVASELLLTGRFIGAERALALGLVSAVVPDQRLEAEARSLAQEMLATTPSGCASPRSVSRSRSTRAASNR